jgi:DNA-binding PadR family transcriptional regulator
MPTSRTRNLTTPDLVLLSLLAERPMHGYEANLELERRNWAGISRPQVYYSLQKLAEQNLIRATEGQGTSSGPERSVFATSAKGRAALADALEGEAWAGERNHPAFLTWIALSWQARPGVFLEQLRRRRKFLEGELSKRGRPSLSRGRMDGQPSDRSISRRIALASKARAGAPSPHPGSKSSIRGPSIGVKRLHGIDARGTDRREPYRQQSHRAQQNWYRDER